MTRILTILLHFILSSLLCIVCACIFHTNMVLFRLQQIDITISLADRIFMSFSDIVNLFPTYGIIVMFGLAIAFFSTYLLKKYTMFKSFYWYTLAGGVSMLIILLALHPIIDASLLAGARSFTGMSLQIIAGLLAGFSFSRLRMKVVKK